MSENMASIVGWRGFVFRNGKLRSLVIPGFEYNVRSRYDNYGSYIFGFSQSVQLHNHVGIWLVKPHTLQRVIKSYVTNVIGICVATPNTLVVEHEQGYRCEDVVIRELWINRNNKIPNLKEALEEEYRCDVHIGYPSGSKVRAITHGYRESEAYN